MPVPAVIHAGNTVQWIEPAALDLNGDAATSASWTLTTFLRFNAANEGATVVGTARADGGWDNAISATTTGGFDAGTWRWESRISSGATVITIGAGTFDALRSLSYEGSPGAFDGRSQAEQDLEAVQAAIRAIISRGARSYTIGTRSYTSQDLSQLMAREAQLKAIVNRERAAEKIAAGLGDPRNLYVRFGQ
jgi:hypothetical protein